MTEMINLIVPPIIVVFAVAILLVFLGKNLSSSRDGGSFILKKGKDRSRSKEKKGGFLKKKSGLLPKISKNEEYRFNSDEKRGDGNQSKKKNDAVNTSTQGITANGRAEKIVSLRKKSMVSDKIENAEGRDPAEIALMQEIEAEPHNSKKYEQLGDYYMEHEQFEDARECYKYVLRLDPRHKRAQVAMRNLDRVLE